MKKRKSIFILPIALLILMGCIKEFSSTMGTVTNTVNFPPNGEVKKTSTPFRTVSAVQITDDEIVRATPTKTKESFEDENQWLKRFYEGVDNCSFPCVGGQTFIVGETNLTEAIENLSFGFVTDNFDGNVDSNQVKYRFEPKTNLASQMYSGLTIVGKDNLVFSSSYLLHSSLGHFLNQYGKPDQVWGWATSSFSPTQGSFEMALLYEEKGILVGFHGYTEKAVFMEICESQLDTGTLLVFLFDPSYDISDIIEDIYSNDYPLYDLPAKNGGPLEEISNIDTENFYKMFIKPSASNCFSMLDAGIYNGDYDVDTQDIVFPTPIVID